MKSEIDRDQEVVRLHGKLFGLSMDAEVIQRRVDELGKQISDDMRAMDPLVIIVLQGAFVFAADLIRALGFDPEVAFVRMSSYDGMGSTGQVQFMPGFDVKSVKGRKVLVIEDIIESGLTLKVLEGILIEVGALELRIVTLLHKPDLNQSGLVPSYTGFEIPNDFVVGYGLDYDQKGRTLPGIYTLIEDE